MTAEMENLQVRQVLLKSLNNDFRCITSALYTSLHHIPYTPPKQNMEATDFSRISGFWEPVSGLGFSTIFFYVSEPSDNELHRFKLERPKGPRHDSVTPSRVLRPLEPRFGVVSLARKWPALFAVRWASDECGSLGDLVEEWA